MTRLLAIAFCLAILLASMHADADMLLLGVGGAASHGAATPSFYLINAGGDHYLIDAGADKYLRQ